MNWNERRQLSEERIQTSYLREQTRQLKTQTALLELQLLADAQRAAQQKDEQARLFAWRQCLIETELAVKNGDTLARLRTLCEAEMILADVPRHASLDEIGRHTQLYQRKELLDTLERERPGLIATARALWDADALERRIDDLNARVTELNPVVSGIGELALKVSHPELLDRLIPLEADYARLHRDAVALTDRFKAVDAKAEGAAVVLGALYPLAAGFPQGRNAALLFANLAYIRQSLTTTKAEIEKQKLEAQQRRGKAVLIGGGLFLLLALLVALMNI